MYPRQSLAKIFATFIEFEADRFNRWVTDPRLNQSLARTKISEISLSERDWVLYWHKRWQQQPDSIAFDHLSAYLQEACYWSAHRTMQCIGHSSYRLSDCFQLASMATEKVLAGYDPDRGASLKTYAKYTYASWLRDTLRQRREANICAGWTLLRRVGKQDLLEALSRRGGLSPPAIDRYRLAWICYKAIYGSSVAPTGQPRDPDRDQWVEIATLYNAERLHRLSEPGPVFTPSDLEEWLTQCITWVREYTYPPMASLNAPSSHQDAGELQDNLSDDGHPTALNRLIEVEENQHRQAQQAQVQATMVAMITALDLDSQTLLKLYYCQHLNQTQIATQLGLKQSTVSRRLTKTRDALVKGLVQWSHATLHIPPTPDLVVRMSVVLEEWLNVRYHNQP